MGFKLHLIINNKGEIMAIKITKGNASDLSAVSGITKGLYGKLFGDKDTVLSFNNFFHFFCIKSINLYSFYIFIKSRFVLKHAINNMQQLTHCSN